MSARPIAEILLDLTAERQNWEHAAKARNAEAMNAADDALDDHREEFRQAFKDATGVQWSNVEAALMSGAL
jgi:hypothetical protein